MQLIDLLNKDEALRLECLRLAVAAGTPQRVADFLAFVTEGTALPASNSGFVPSTGHA